MSVLSSLSGSRIDSIMYEAERAASTRDRSGPSRPPLPFTMWHLEQPAFSKICFPLTASPATAACFGGASDRKYATIAQISESSKPLAGMSVPGTPCEIVRKISASLDPCVHRPDVRSGPRPPPRAFNPWHGEQLPRNREAPSLTTDAFVFKDDGGEDEGAALFSCAVTKDTERTAPANRDSVANRAKPECSDRDFAAATTSSDMCDPMSDGIATR